MTYKSKTFRRAAAAAAAICLAFAFAFAEETGADRLGFGTSVTVSADDGYIYTDTAKITYTMDVNGIVTITAVDAGYKTSVVIPDTIAGGTVMGIGGNAFRWDCQYVESVTLPPNITKIGSEAFRNCSNLKSINIPDKVKFIYDYAFSDCSSLTNITLPADITKIGYAAFSRCSSLTSIVIPLKVTNMGEDVFEKCSSLETVFCPYDLSLNSLGIDQFRTTRLNYTQDSTTNDVAVTFVNRGADIPETINGGTVKTVFIPSSLSSNTGSVPAGAAKITYEKDSNYKVTITKVEPGTDQTSIVIPGTIDGGTVTAIGDNAFENCSSLTSITLPDSLTGIGSYAFENCTALQSIDIPQNVTSIGSYAFQFCKSLASVSIHSDIQKIEEYTFADCTSLTSINIPDSVESIGEGTFFLCTSLTSIVIPQNVKTIGMSAFANCNDLTSINIPQNVTSIKKSTFACCNSLTDITIPQNVTSIGEGAFSECVSLKAVFLPDGISIKADAIPSGTAKIYYTKDADGNVTVTDVEAGSETSIEIPKTIGGLDVRVIKEEAFKGCGNIKNIILPDSITEIQNGAFQGCTALESINIPAGITRIGTAAFKDCSALKSVDMPASVSDSTNIGSDAFKNCKKLESIYLPIGISMIRSNTFENCISLTVIDIPTSVQQISEEAFINCTALTSIIVPEGVTIIGNGVFSNCSSLESVSLPESLKEFMICTFGNCTSLKNVNIPKGITNIEDGTFLNCKALAEITLPEGVTRIGIGAFESCSSLETIALPSSTKNIKQDAFAGCTSLKTIFLPQNAAQETASIPDGTAKIYYTKDANGNVTISDVKEGNETSIVIPETICGAAVTALGDGAFEVNENITSVILPDSVTSIGYNAFFDCVSLKSIKLPKNITSIEKTTFADCTSLTDIEIPENVTSLKAGAFAKCDRLAKVTLPDKLTEIGDAAFRNCPSLTEINIPSGLTSIGERAFIDCSFTTIELPENLQSVGSDAFLDCYDLIKLFYPAGIDISAASVPEASAKIKYEIRGGYAYILEITPDTANTPVVIPDTIRGYEVKYVEEIYRQYVSETGHTHKGGTATCTEQALCDICGKSYDSTDLTNHDADTSVWKYDENGHWNPCLRAGCEEHLNAAAHTFDNGVVTTEPTENSEGVKTYTCEICGYKKTETVPKLGHTPSAEWSYDSDNHWKECTAEGCNEKLELAAHTFDNGVITVKPTESSEGVKTYTCEVCGYEKTESIEKLPSKPAEVIYPIAISGDVTVDKSSAAAGETVNVSAPFGYDIIVADNDGNVIAKISEKGSFEMPSSRVSITAVRGETFAHMSNAWSHSYVYSYDSDMNRIKVNSDTIRGIITIDLGTDYAGKDFTVYSGRKSTSKKIISGTLDENGRYTFNADEGRNYTLVVE